MTTHPVRFIALLNLIAILVWPLAADEVSVTTEMITLPTYKMGPDEKQPLYRGFKVPGMRVFRATRTTYPYPKADNFGHERRMVKYKAITLENEFIKAVVIPDLRGRLQGAYDKRNNWDFLYYNHVIKPGDIANRAGWLAGGLEWNHPGGHGYTQFETLSHKIIENDDGSKTVLVAEIEPVRMMKWETAITLRPGSLAVETEGRFYSVVPYPVPFASSLNGAMHATDGMEAIYPEGSYITGHGKRYVKPWPVYDGVDHRWFRNLKSSYSVFTEGSTEDFFGCYSHDKNAGTVVVADHRTAPGKKYFSWGSHPAGRRWDTLLSDEDGPYIELQVGAFWENLGYGYAWLDPMEMKKYTVHWYPVKDLGGFVKANEHMVINLKRDGDRGAMIAVQAAHMHPGNSITIKAAGRTIYEKTLDLDPAKPFVDKFPLTGGVDFTDLKLTIKCEKGNVLMTYQPFVKHPPAPKLPAPRVAPEKTRSIDELHMWGKGFYHDPFGEEPESYYREILRRAPMDVRGNRALGLMALHRGQWGLAIEHLERSLDNDPLNDGFVNHYYIGLASLEKGDLGRARDEFTTASRVARLNIPALYHLAVVAMQDGDYRKAVHLLREVIDSGGVHPQIQSTLAVAFRKMGNTEGATAARKKALAEDPLEFLAMLEQWKAGELSAAEIHNQFDRRAPFFVGSQLYMEGAAFYGRLGAWDDVASILEEGVRHLSANGKVYPMVEYYLGYAYSKQGQKHKAKAAFTSAAKRDPTYVFPYSPLDIATLEAATKSNPADARAWRYMGNALFYLRRSEDAERAWLRSKENDPTDPSVLRSLALAGYAMRQDLDRAIEQMEEASAADPSDPRILLELDYFLDAAGKTARRARLLSEREATVRQRDELVLTWSRLLLRKGDHAKAVDLMDNRRFFARERRAQTHAVYAEAHYGLGEQLLADGKTSEALAEFRKGMEYPENLGEGALADEVFARAQYLIGVANQKSGKNAAAKQAFQKIAETPIRKDTESAIYQALALRELGRGDEAMKLLRETDSLCRSALASGKGEASLMNYLLSRTLSELGNTDEAQTFLQTALEADADVVLKSRIAASQPPA